jgi:phage repressor protein C with HTH and peptisase S24 domain
MESWERIQFVIDREGLNKNSFSEAIGLSSNVTIGRIINEKRKASPETCRKIVARFPHYNYMWLLKGEGEMLKTSVQPEESKNARTSSAAEIPENAVAIDLFNLSINRQPIIDIQVCAGTGIGLEGDENKVIEWVNIPNFDGCIGITVFGDSMYDKYKSGDILFVRRVWGHNDFDPGQSYVVITREDRYLRNIYEVDGDEEHIVLAAYNVELNPDGRKKYPDKKMHVDDIKHLYKVSGRLRRDQL